MMFKKLPSYILLLSLIIFTAGACTKADINFGSQYVDNSFTQVVKVDSFPADISTAYIDSFSTTGKGVTLVGGYADPYFGRIDTRTYFEIAPPTTTATDFTKAIYDSIYLTLKLNKNYYGDTAQSIHIDVSQLAELIVPPTSFGSTGFTLYNTDHFAVKPTPLGSTDVVIRPNLTDSIHIKLSDVLGADLLAKIKAGDPIIQNATNFLNYFNGMRISSNASSVAIFGFRDSMSVHLAYHLPALYKDTASVQFSLANTTHHFTNISVDRSGTLINNLGSLNAPGKKNVISSSATNNMAFTQSASGAMIKLRFPNIQNVLKLPNYLKLLRAQLILRPVQSSYSPFYYLPPQLRLATTTLANDIGNNLVVPNATGAASIQYGNLFLDYFNNKTSYTYDLTAYIEAILQDPSYPYNQDGLLLVPPSPALESQFSRAVFGDKHNPVVNNQIELDIYYVGVQL